MSLKGRVALRKKKRISQSLGFTYPIEGVDLSWPELAWVGLSSPGHN